MTGRQAQESQQHYHNKSRRTSTVGHRPPPRFKEKVPDQN